LIIPTDHSVIVISGTAITAVMAKVLDGRHTAMMLIVVFAATFMDGLDASIVNVVLPEIGSGFSVDTATVSWVSITYMMVLAGTLVAFARIAADIGVRKVMAVGLAVFTLGSLFCGLSFSFELLIVSRAVQAVGAAMMAASGPMCCTEHLPVAKLGFGLSIVTIGASFGFAIGPAIGGFIAEYTTWPWIFLINVPIGFLVAPLMLKAVPESSEKGGKIHLDVPGTVLLCSAIVLGTFAVETVSQSGMRTFTIIAAILCLALLILFVRAERGKERPLLRLGMFARSDFVAIFICLMMMNMAYMGLFYLLPFFGQICMGMSPLTVGTFLLISALITAAFGMPIGRMSDRKGRKWFCVTAGLVTAVAFGLLAIFAGNMTFGMFLVIMVPMGLGWAFVGGPMASRLVEHAGDERDMASSLTNEAYYVGGAIGTALAATLFTLFSGSGGINISDITSSMMLDGFVPTAVICTLMVIAVAVISFAVRDGKDRCESDR
jgi:EmrB/QacA subfamily drug resistance transporter